jgi:hypothetical protein
MGLGSLSKHSTIIGKNVLVGFSVIFVGVLTIMKPIVLTALHC